MSVLPELCQFKKGKKLVSLSAKVQCSKVTGEQRAIIKGPQHSGCFLSPVYKGIKLQNITGLRCPYLLQRTIEIVIFHYI